MVIDMKNALGLLGVVVVLGFSGSAIAQNPRPAVTVLGGSGGVVEIGEMSMLLGELREQAATTNGSASEEKEKPKKGPSELAKRFKKLKFDRRQSTILKVWSEPIPDAPEKSEELVKADEELATADAELAELTAEVEAAKAVLEALESADKVNEEAQGEADGAVNVNLGLEDAAKTEAAAEATDEAEKLENDPADAGDEAGGKAGDAPASKESGSEGAVQKDPAEKSATTTGETNASSTPETGSAEVPVSPQPELEVLVAETSGEDSESSEDVLAPKADDADAQPSAASQKKKIKELEDKLKDATKAQQDASKAAEKLAKEHDEALLEHDIVLLQRSVSLGDWTAIEAYFAKLDEDDAKAGYARILNSLVEGPGRVQGQFANYGEKNLFTPDYLRDMIEAAPYGFEEENLDKLGALLAQAVASGNLIELCVARLRELTQGEETAIGAVEMARVLTTAGYPVEAGDFLPDPDQAVADNDRKALNLLSRHYLARHQKDAKGEYLEQAWKVIQAALADGEIDEKDKEEALKRAVEVAPRIADELGIAWLRESFTDRPERGMEILRVIGESASKALMQQAKKVDTRFKSIELQTTAAEALLKAAPELAAEWRGALDLLASNWLKEAQHSYIYDTSSTRGPRMTRDVYGNTFYRSYSASMRRNIPDPIRTDQLLDVQPSELWLEHVSEALRPKYAMVLAQLLLKVGDESEAFPFIERMAGSLPERAKDLAEEFLSVWTKNHDPNSNQNNTNQYMFFYGFEQRANAIPLTRSKQLRNLNELADWVARIRALPIEKVDETLITRAFTASHSAAEVYRIEDIERIYGQIEDLEPETLAALIQRMRSNLVGVWRQPSTQKDNKTRRRQKDIQAEILRGYDVVKTVITAAMQRHRDEWSLALAHASVLHDENNFKHEIAKSAEFSIRRQEAFDGFARAADLYIDHVDGLEIDEESAEVFLVWFYASLGSCDPNALRSEMVFAESEVDLIREAILDLPDEAAKRHMDKFASQLFSRMSSVSPAVKFRYAGAGLNIVDDNELASEAREIYDYYRDLTSEIRLETRIDGDARVAHGVPFGVYVDLRHTREIEREAGGFGKYLTNQNKQTNSFNYGRPTENYRDKFEETAREILSENFEVHSVTFNHPDAHSQAEAEYGWRVTPYAYILLESRGPEIDSLPPLRLDLDFLDTSGYAVLPIESSPLVVDSKGTTPGMRPYSNLAMTQTLDERQAKDGKLMLEIVASATGVVPELDEITEVQSEGFEVVAVDDQGVSVSKFDEEGGGRGVITERTWMITLNAAEDLDELPKAFSFPVADGVEMEFQRYVDADLDSVDRVVSLEQSYGKSNSPWAWYLGLGAGGLLLFGMLVRWLRSSLKNTQPKQQRFQLPESLTPFTVMGLLHDMDRAGVIRQDQRDDLLKDIRQLEGHYFENNGHGEPNLPELAHRWLKHVS